MSFQHFFLGIPFSLLIFRFQLLCFGHQRGWSTRRSWGTFIIHTFDFIFKFFLDINRLHSLLSIISLLLFLWVLFIGFIIFSSSSVFPFSNLPNFLINIYLLLLLMSIFYRLSSPTLIIDSWNATLYSFRCAWNNFAFSSLESIILVCYYFILLRL